MGGAASPLTRASDTGLIGSPPNAAISISNNQSVALPVTPCRVVPGDVARGMRYELPEDGCAWNRRHRALDPSRDVSNRRQPL